MKSQDRHPITKIIACEAATLEADFISSQSDLFTPWSGRVGPPGRAPYAAAKFGVEGFSESLSKEVGPLGIKVTIVEPGGFRTDFAGASRRHAGV